MPRTSDGITIAELEAVTCHLASLAEFYLDSGTIRVWTGLGDLVWNSNVYQGIGAFGQVSEIEEQVNAVARNTTLRLAGTYGDESVDGFREAMGRDLATENIKNRAVKLYVAVLTDGGEILGEPILLRSAVGDQLIADEENGVPTLTLTLEDRSKSFKRRQPRRYTLADHQTVNPASRALEYAPALRGKRTYWGQSAP